MKIYLSPSKQPANTYATGNTNEQEQMERLAQAVALALSEYECDVRIANTNLTVSDITHDGLPGRIWEAKGWGADLYVPIHSNAGGVNSQGPQVYMGNRTTKAEELANAVLRALQMITPGTDPSSKVVWSHARFAEIRYPERVGMQPLYLEVEFHHRTETAQWIINHIDLLAGAIADGIAHGAGLKRKPVVGVAPAAGSGHKMLYRVKTLEGDRKVQVGSYGSLDNALTHAKKLLSTGASVEVETVK